MPRNLSNDNNTGSSSSSSNNEDPTFNSVQTNTLVAQTAKTSNIQTLDGEGETLQIKCNFITRPIGSTLQLAPDQITCASTISTSENVSVGTSILAGGDIVSTTGKVEATNGSLIGVSSDISNRLVCESIHLTNGVYSNQELRCGHLIMSSGAHTGWSIQQGENGSNEQDALGFTMPTSGGTFNVLDETGNPLFILSKFGLISQKLMNQNANLILSSASTLKFGGYAFRPTQFTRDATITIRSTPDRTNFTNMIFNCQSTSDFINVNTGQNESMYNAALEGIYKCSVSQNGTSSANSYTMVIILFDYVLRLSTQSTPDIIPSVSYGYRIEPSGALPPTVEVDHLNTPIQSQPVYLNFPGSNSAAGETMDVTVRLTQMPW